MNKILVDTSIWIDYFKFKTKYNILTELIKENAVCTNQLILTELIPFLKHQKHDQLIEALLAIDIVDLNIDWETIIKYQVMNLKKGLNKVGIPDLIILQNVLDNNLILFSKDKHFSLMSHIYHFKMFES